MFENLQRELQRLAKLQQIEVPIESDAEGFSDKECPAEACLFQFKVHSDDWKDLVRDEEVFCPSCRHAAPSTSWFTTAQVEAAKEYAFGSVVNGLNSAMRADAGASKRRQNRNSFLSITLEAKGGKDAVLLPIAAAEPMRLRTICESCGCRYSYVGAAYFCPSCGQNSASHTFLQTLSTIRTAAQLGPTLRSSLGADEAEVMTRTLLEKAMQDTVMSFQRLAEQLYERTGKVARRNAFQSLDAGSELWATELGATYEELLDVESMKRLRIYYQRRHLLAHQQGIVDSDYISRCGDSAYSVGQRLVIRDSEVLEFADLVERLGQALMSRTPS
jgi:RNA polymerase subunit RPABC4/transcription elongation factor Spt4